MPTGSGAASAQFTSPGWRSAFLFMKFTEMHLRGDQKEREIAAGGSKARVAETMQCEFSGMGAGAFENSQEFTDTRALAIIPARLFWGV